MSALTPYDYKIFVTGPFQSGKTTLIHTLDPYAISIDRPLPRPYRGVSGTTTTGFDLGRIAWVREEELDDGIIVPRNDYTPEDHNGCIVKEIELRGVPGPLHFKFVRDTMRNNSNAVFLLVDSSDPDMIEDAKSHLQEVHLSFHGIPHVVFASKQDRHDAVSPEEVAEWVGVDEAIGITTHDAQACRSTITRVLRSLLAS